MGELALYRKYRPQAFADVVGQDHIIEVLEKSLKSGAIAHAYLFFGSRGTGKTSIARIVARELGCAPEDIYEIDAASNRGIDDVRELREGVRSLPFRSPYKAYIIDEVHMLSKDAFNAFLKTLEEPPKHVVFMLATTEIEKVPETVVSRCQTFTFKKPSRVILKKVVEEIARKEGRAIEPGAAALNALLGDRSFRDTQGVLQLVLSGTTGTVTREGAEKITAAPSSALVEDFIAALAEGKLESVLGVIRTATEQNLNFKLFLKLILEAMRTILLFRFSPKMKDELRGEFSSDEIQFFERYAGSAGASINSQTLVEILDAYTAIGRAHIPELPLELAVIKLLKKA
mgnify:FL=1